MENKVEEVGREKKNPGAGFGKWFEDVSSKTKDFAEKTQETFKNVVDINGDGKIDREDFGLSDEQLQQKKEKMMELASAAVQQVKGGNELLEKVREEARLDRERKALRPVFAQDLTQPEEQNRAEFALPKMLCIVTRDKKHSESAACEGAVGHWSTVKGVELLNLYEDTALQAGLTFYPMLYQTFYYENPFQKGLYIGLDEYFDYLKRARVSELKRIAQDLGAKRVQITFKETKKRLVKNQGNVFLKAAEPTVGSVTETNQYDRADSEYSKVEIAADVRFSGHEKPKKPKVVYFKNEKDIEDLVQMRTGRSENKVTSEIYHFHCSKTSGITAAAAAQIDAVLGQLKCEGSASISSEVQRESRTELEYIIEF